ncbi:MAG TPA: ADP-ribosyltransferase [Candidatus Xenobia bacterium]
MPENPGAVFKNDAEMEAWIERNALAWAHRLTDAERWAAKIYKGSKGAEYEAINGWLRRLVQLLPNEVQRVRSVVAHLDTALAKGSLDREMILFRGVKPYPPPVIGERYLDAAYWSTTPSWEVAELYAGDFEPGYIFQMRLPPGTRAGFPDRLGVSEGELEVLLQRGTMYRVADIRTPRRPSMHRLVIIEEVSW